MRIVYITAALPYGTGEAFIVEEVRELISLGHKILIVPRSPGKRVLHGPTLTPLTRRQPLFSLSIATAALEALRNGPRQVLHATDDLLRFHPLRQCLKNAVVIPKAIWLARIARKWHADHIHCHWAGTTATMAMIASRLSGIPWSFTAHRWDIVENNALAAKARSAAFVRAISEGGARLMGTKGVGRNPKLRVLHMGVKLPARVRWTPPAAPVVLCPANLVQVKGHRFLLEAWRQLVERGVQGELWLAGGGELARALENLAVRMGIGATVRFLGPVKHESLLAFYERNLISAVALASIDLGGGTHEGIPVALAEAMSYGVPVIATTTGSIAELVTPGAGMLVPPQDPPALAGALTAVLRDRTLAQRLSLAARERIEQSYDISSIAGELELLFNKASVPQPRETCISLGAN